MPYLFRLYVSPNVTSDIMAGARNKAQSYFALDCFVSRPGLGQLVFLPPTPFPFDRQMADTSAAQDVYF